MFPTTLRKLFGCWLVFLSITRSFRSPPFARIQAPDGEWSSDFRSSSLHSRRPSSCSSSCKPGNPHAQDTSRARTVTIENATCIFQGMKTSQDRFKTKSKRFISSSGSSTLQLNLRFSSTKSSCRILLPRHFSCNPPSSLADLS